MSKKKNVHVFVDGEVLVIKHFSGIGHYTAELLRAVDKLLYLDEYSHISVEIGVPKNDMHRLNRFGYENFKVRRMPFSPHVANGLKKRHRLPPIDLLYGKKVYLFPNYSCWPALFSPVVPIIYDLSFVHHAEFVEPRNQAFLIEQVRLSASKAKKIVTISKNSQAEIETEFSIPSKDIDIVYPAVDRHLFYPRSDYDVSYTKAKNGVFGDYILFVGNIEPRKNLVTLLRAYNQLPAAIQEKYGLLLIGAKGWLDNEIHDMIIDMRMRGLKIIQPTGYVEDEDLPALYSGASAFVYVSKYEGFGIPPIEAMACNTPVISSNNSSLPEAVGDAAIMIDAADDAALCENITKLLNDKKIVKKYVDRGSQQILNFDWDKSARQLLKTLEEAAK
ncbi:MAG: glycosyltransferase family 1 protein [Candidatus Saccharimonadales bacterium]